MDPIPAEAENVLHAFRRLVEIVWKSNLATNPPPRVRLTRTIACEQSESKCEMTGFDTDLLEAQLPRLRQFWEARKDGSKSIRFERVMNIIGEHCTVPAIREKAAVLRKGWRALFDTEADQFDATIYQMQGTLEQECDELFYGFEGLFHVDPHAAKPEPNPFRGGRLHLALRPMFVALGEAYRLVGQWRGWPDALETGGEA
jgi:hypothetical protein